jgi:hypothetical protein
MSKRKPNWTDREKMILMEEYVKKKDVLRAKYSSVKRKMKEIQKKWNNICSSVEKKMENVCQPPPSPL